MATPEPSNAHPAPRLLQLARAADAAGDDPARSPILDAALSAFLEAGVRRTSMGEIARRSGLSPATLYRRFAQKSDVVLGVGLREVRRFLDHVDARIDYDAPADEQVVELFVAFVSGLHDNRLLRRLLDTEPETVLPLLTTRGGPVLGLGSDYLAEFIRRLQHDGRLPAFDSEPVAEMIARVALSMTLIPQTVIPLDDEPAARQFAREHIMLAFRLPAG